VEVLKQPQYQPLPWVDQVLAIFAATNGYMDGIPVSAVHKFESEFLAHMRSSQTKLRNQMEADKQLSDESTQTLKSTLEGFVQSFSA
jgi:F-type H+-transporting ATPase subunit alpha